jgi:hypothetical protein
MGVLSRNLPGGAEENNLNQDGRYAGSDSNQALPSRALLLRQSLGRQYEPIPSAVS